MKYSLTGFKLIGVTAPLLGACCTIYGLIDCFQAAKNAEFVSLWAIAGGVSESLFTFAFGLTVAIPAAALFIYLKSHAARRRVTLRREARSLVSEILGRIPTRALLFESSSVTRTMETEAPPSQTRWLAWTERDDMPTSLWQQD
jgi:biopolymer transport protein ExbB/TolQ